MSPVRRITEEESGSRLPRPRLTGRLAEEVIRVPAGTEASVSVRWEDQDGAVIPDAGAVCVIYGPRARRQELRVARGDDSGTHAVTFTPDAVGQWWFDVRPSDRYVGHVRGVVRAL